MNLENTKVYTTDMNVIRKYGELCGVTPYYDQDRYPEFAGYRHDPEEQEVLASFLSGSLTDRNAGLKTLTAEEINAMHQEKFGQIESPEEREALDMIDTTSKQVESLANNSESPNGTKYDRAVGGPIKLSPPEWCGEGLPPVGVECEILFKEYPHKGFGLFSVLGYHGGVIWVQYIGPLENNGKCYTAECSTLEFRKPESPEQKAERERLEIVKKACLTVRHDYGLMTESDRNFLEKHGMEWLKAFEKLGYTKELK